MGADNAPSNLYYESTPSQKVAGLLAIISSIVALGLLIKWMKGTNYDESFLGGLNFKEYIFNYHPIFMLSGLILASLTALLSYRLIPAPKTMTKSLHGLLHTCALCCIVIGLTCVIVGNNYPDYNTGGAYYPNLTSLHSFLGLTAIALYFQNYILGLYHFVFPLSIVPIEKRKSYMPYHVFLGGFAFFAAVFAVETGIMELTSELGCYWDPTSANINPAKTYDRLPYGCQYANGVGILVLLSALTGAYALMDFSRFNPQNRNPDDIKTGFILVLNCYEIANSQVQYYLVFSSYNTTQQVLFYSFLVSSIFITLQ